MLSYFRFYFIYNSLLTDKKEYYEQTGLSLKKEVSEYKKEKEFGLRISVLLMSGGRSPSDISKTGRPPAPVVFGSEISNREQTLGFC